MNLRHAIVSILLVSFSFAGTICADDKVDPSGTWRWEYEMQGETRNDALMINLADDGKTVVGKFDGNGENQIEIKDGKFDGKELSLMVPIEFNGTEIELRFSGTIEKDSLDGTVVADVNGETYDFPWTPERSVKTDDLVGEWGLEIPTDGGQTFRPTLKISEKESGDIEAEYTSEIAGPLTVDRVELKDNHLHLKVSTEYEGTEVNLKFKMRPFGDKIKGECEYDFNGEVGSLNVKGARKKSKA